MLIISAKQIQSLKDYFSNKFKQGKEPIFFEKIGDNKNQRRDA